MRGTSIVAATALLVGVSTIAGNATAQVQVGTVDLQRVRSEATQFRKALAEIDDMVEEFEKRRDRRRNELEELSEELRDVQRRGLQGSADRLRNRLQDKSQDFQQFMEETFGKDGIIEAKSSELLRPLYDKLAEAAKKVARSKNLDLILDLEAANPLYASERLDVTDAVLEEFAKLW